MKPFVNCRSRLSSRSGQALVEFTFVAATLLLLFFGLIDFCRAISVRQVITSLSREGSNLASRNTSLSNSIAAVLAASDPLNITNNGRIFISVVINTNGTPWVADQMTFGGISTNNNTDSKIGHPGGPAKMPVTNPSLPQLNQTIYVTEIYYSFEAVTPVGKVLNFALPPRLYDAAYF